MPEGTNDQVSAEVEVALESESLISAHDVNRWMRTCSLDTMGALSILLFEHAGRIQPSLDLKTVCDFRRTYYTRCLSEAVQGGKYHPSRYVAGHEFDRWFMSLWRDDAVPRRYLEDLKAMLTQLYLSGDPEVRDCVVTSVLEHLFETPEIAEFFSDWKQDSVLREAYESAMEWPNAPPKKP